jgi:hypothetical protein
MEAWSEQSGCASFTFMLKDYQTKDISNRDVAEPTQKKIEFNFPEYGITVEAVSLEEAEKELKKLINK